MKQFIKLNNEDYLLGKVLDDGRCFGWSEERHLKLLRGVDGLE